MFLIPNQNSILKKNSDLKRLIMNIPKEKVLDLSNKSTKLYWLKDLGEKERVYVYNIASVFRKEETKDQLVVYFDYIKEYDRGHAMSIAQYSKYSLYTKNMTYSEVYWILVSWFLAYKTDTAIQILKKDYSFDNNEFINALMSKNFLKIKECINSFEHSKTDKDQRTVLIEKIKSMEEDIEDLKNKLQNVEAYLSTLK